MESWCLVGWMLCVDVCGIFELRMFGKKDDENDF